jgi:branched-chain amino acid aminotransferase
MHGGIVGRRAASCLAVLPRWAVAAVRRSAAAVADPPHEPMHQFLPYAWFGGKCVPFAEATLSVATHALHYGTGAFGGMRALPNPADANEILLFRADRHARRLSQSARLLLTELSEATIHHAIQEFLQANRPTCPVYLRPFVYTSDLGIAPRLHNIETDFLIYGLELGDYLSPEGVSCRISSWTRQEDRSLPLRGKISGAYITSSLAKTEAVKSGFDEALLLNSRGKVSEASGMNLFLVRDGVLITPGVDQDILEGITRASVLELAKAMGIPTLERPVDKSELFIADEVFLSGTAAKVTPVRRVETTELSGERPVMNAIRERLTAITEGRDPAFDHWVSRIRLQG